jgi:tungstate transport system permease protein
MELILEGVTEAWALIRHMDPIVMSAALRTLWVSSLAVGLAAMIGLPIGAFLARHPFPGRALVVLLCRAGMAAPTVFVGIVCYAVFSRRGPLGPMEVLFTPWAIVAGELALALPIVISITHGAVKSLDPRVAQTAISLGAGPVRRWRTYLSEARVGVSLSVLTAFARCVTELGIAMLVGGNILGRTRTLATATALETAQGDFGRGLAMGFILLLIALMVMAFIVLLSGERRR